MSGVVRKRRDVRRSWEEEGSKKRRQLRRRGRRRGKQAGFDASIGPRKKSSSAMSEAFDWGASPALELTIGETSG
jgi:hypothetical protein